MDAGAVVCIRCHPATSAADSPPTSIVAHRLWTVSVSVNDGDPKSIVLRDPLTLAQYEAVLDRYLRDSDRPRWEMGLEDERATRELHTRAEHHIDTYAEDLWGQIDSVIGPGASGVAEYQLYVVEKHDSTSTTQATEGGIHCLAWELLEARTQKPRLRITRVEDFPARLHSHTRIFNVPQPLAAVRGDAAGMFRVLLVVARDFSRWGAARDAEPDLAQYPLMTVQKKLRSKMLLEVVRPGSQEELEAHLGLRAKQGVLFHLVHFDLHGRIKKDANGVMVPWLLFARQHPGGFDETHGMPQTNLASAESVALLLARYKVENVVLNACLSAYNRHSSSTNLAHLLLRHGIRNVSAMWYYVHWQTVSTYLESFYTELLVRNADFHLAAQRGREAVRRRPTSRTGREYQDFFLCVNYARDAHRTDSMLGRDSSPSSSADSNDSSPSNSLKTGSSNGPKWKPPTPRLSDGFGFPAVDQPMRMRLHLLELEYKLTSFKIVYASDLQRSDAGMNATIDGMVDMWLATNLVDEVLFYRGKDLGKRRTDSLPYRERRTRASASVGAGFAPPTILQQLLSPRAVQPIRQTLHVIRDVDFVIDPGTQADEERNRRSEERRLIAEENLKAMSRRVHEPNGGGGSYMLLVGCQDAQWWRAYFDHLHGEWWLHMPWSFTVHSRYNRATKLPHEGRRSLTPSPMGRRRR